MIDFSLIFKDKQQSIKTCCSFSTCLLCESRYHNCLAFMRVGLAEKKRGERERLLFWCPEGHKKNNSHREGISSFFIFQLENKKPPKDYMHMTQASGAKPILACAVFKLATLQITYFLHLLNFRCCDTLTTQHKTQARGNNNSNSN